MTSARQPEQLQPNSYWGLSKAGLWLPGRTVGIWSLTLGDGLMPDHAPLALGASVATSVKWAGWGLF